MFESLSILGDCEIYVGLKELYMDYGFTWMYHDLPKFAWIWKVLTLDKKYVKKRVLFGTYSYQSTPSDLADHPANLPNLSTLDAARKSHSHCNDEPQLVYNSNNYGLWYL